MIRPLVLHARVPAGRRAAHPRFLLALLGLLAGTLPVSAQISVSGGTGPATVPAKPVVAISLSAKPPEKPDLTFALLPRLEDTQKGNGAVKYLSGIVDIFFNIPKDEGEVVERLRSAPLGDLDETAATAVLARYGSALRLFHDGARFDTVDWETNMRREGYSARMPNLNHIHHVANVLAVAIHLDIKHHRWTDARDKLQTGYALARHLGQGETLSESLVGVAIAQGMSKCVEDWIAQPDAPNIYWPLVNLPSPFNDLRRALAFDRASIVLSFPELRQVAAGRFSAEQWISLVTRLSDFTHDMMLDTTMPGGKMTPPWQRQLTAVGLAAMEYPRAKQFLLARGVSADQVEKLPVPEVLGRYYLRVYEESADDMFKWLALPYPQVIKGYVAAERSFSLAAESSPHSLLSLLPSLARAPFLAGRLDRHIAMLSILENIRAYAADQHDLPDSLDQLPLYVPLDALTGKPFQYERHGASATLIAPPPNPAYPREGDRYDLTLRHP